jgi:hypothetical protein
MISNPVTMTRRAIDQIRKIKRDKKVPESYGLTQKNHE